MKKILLILLLSPIALSSQYLSFPTTYDSESAGNEICRGNIKKYLSDTVEWVIEKKNDRWVSFWKNRDEANSDLNKIFFQGIPEYSSRTNAGYWFYVAIIDPKDETKIIQFVKFQVNHYSQKIELIEIQRKEK
jgi:hypothetical protein